MLIDVNCSLGRWPFQEFADLTAGKMERRLADWGISCALVSAVEAVLCPDPHVHNLRLLRRLRRHPGLKPLMVLDPSLGHWRDCLREYGDLGCGDAVKVYPNYRRCSLDSACMGALMEELARERGKALVIQMRVEDERAQYPLMKVPGTPVAEIVALAKRFPQTPVVCLCPYLPEAVALVEATENVSVDIAFVEHMNTLQTFLKRVPARRVLFGSHTPFLYTEASLMKVRFAEIPAEDLRAVSSGNAQRIFRLGRMAGSRRSSRPSKE